jgi:hypothetical protein
MFPDTFTLQNEGFLMQGCLKASFSGLLAAPNAQPGPFYAAFFNYAIGLERRLKILRKRVRKRVRPGVGTRTVRVMGRPLLA